MRELLLGIDIGTSACKLALFDKTGKIAAGASREYNVYYPHPGWAEQNPDEWWSAVCKASQEIMSQSKIQSQEIVGVGVDGQSWSAIPIDKEGRVLANTPIWMDTRSRGICERLNRTVGADEIFRVAGNPLQPSYTTPKIIWYKENRADIYKDIYKILQSNAYIVYRLTGVCSQDKSQGYGLHCFNMRQGIWDRGMCKKLGVEEGFLSEIYECQDIVGTVTGRAAGQTGLLEGTPVVAGALDAACGTLGAGVLKKGETQEQGGQAGGMSICLEEYRADPRLILSYHAVKGRWLLQGGTTGGGGVMRWLEKELGDYERMQKNVVGKSSLEQFNELAEKIPPGSDGLIFLPYMAGERSPIWDPYAKGVYFGLDFSKTKGHLIRSGMEGVAYALKHNIDVGEEAGACVGELSAMGGAANSRLWTQMKADVTGKSITVPASDTATTLGAAILAGVGVGLYRDCDEAVALTVQQTRRHEPDMIIHEKYMRYYSIYLELYNQLKETMKGVSE